MTLFLKLIASAAISAAVLLGGVYYGKQNTQPTQTQSFGSFQPVQAAQFTLAGAGITNSQNTIQLASFALPDPNKTPITMAMFGAIGYGVLDPQTSKIENVSFTGVTQNSNGSATLTGVSRGLSFYTPYAASTTLAVSHAGGATFILSNSGAFYGQQFAFTNNANTFSAVNIFGSTTPPKYDADPIWANFTTQAFADVSYVNSVVAAGCANAATGIKGCVQIATGLQAASSTGTGSTGALLVLPASIATDTPNTGSNTSKVLMSDLTGHLKQAWLDLTQAFTTSGAWTFSNTSPGTTIASSTFTTAVNVSAAATTTFNGGGLNGVYDYQVFTGNGTWTKPANVLGTELVMVEEWGAGGGGGTSGAASGTSGGGGGGGGACIIGYYRASDLTSTVTVTVGTGAAATVGGNTTFGTFLTAYGGGAGQSESGATNASPGGGGGGQLSVGTAGSADTTGGSGGGPAGGGSTAANSGFGGAGGGAGGAGGAAAYGGGGGGGANGGGSGGGASVCGGGGGAGGGSSVSGGTSVFGGAGGAAVTNTIGTVGSAPGGGGGGGSWTSGAAKAGGAGGRGEVRVWTYR